MGQQERVKGGRAPAGWISVTEQLPPLGDIVQDAGAERGGSVTVPLAARFPPDDLSSVRRESDIVLALIEEDENGPVFYGREPRRYRYIEYADGRKLWDDWRARSTPYDAVLRPTHWCQIPGGVGALREPNGGKSKLGPPLGWKFAISIQAEEAEAQRKDTTEVNDGVANDSEIETGSSEAGGA